MSAKIVLHAGCGCADHRDIPPGFRTPDWREVRFDIDPAVAPDIVGSITDMAPVITGSIDALYNSHVIEHLYPHEVPVALREFHRVLAPDGFVVLACPDLQSIAERVAADNLMEPVSNSAAGPVAPIDMLYGHRPSLAAGNLFMAHRTGFTARSLMRLLMEAGFANVAVARTSIFALWAIATRRAVADDELQRMHKQYLPAQIHPG